MSYIPKYCCECGEKIERASWNLFTNRRFCEFCETNLGIYDWIPSIILSIGIILAVVGAGNILLRPEKQVAISSNQLSANFQNSNKNSLSSINPPQNSNTNTVQKAVQQKEIANVAQLNQTAAAFKQNVQPPASQSKPAQEIVYFCGAQTKKGTPCTRRVKNGGRCWQHLGQPAMLPPEKLIANR